jgi:hypothetical protein
MLLLQPGRLVLAGGRISASASVSASVSSTRLVVLNNISPRGVSLLCGRAQALARRQGVFIAREQRRFTA